MIEILSTILPLLLQIAGFVMTPVALGASYALFRSLRKRREELDQVVEAQKETLNVLRSQADEMRRLAGSFDAALQDLRDSPSLPADIRSRRVELLLEYRLEEARLTSLASSVEEELSDLGDVDFRSWYSVSMLERLYAFRFSRLYARSGDNVQGLLRELNAERLSALREFEARLAELSRLKVELAVLSESDRVTSDQNQQGDSTLGPEVLIGLVGSIASIISLLQQNKERLSPEVILKRFWTRAEDPGTPEYKLGKVAKDADILANARIMLGVHATDSMFLDRIRERCLNPYYEAISDHELDDVDLEDIRGKTANCVCTNINMARKDNGGSFPSDAFKDLWKQFGCT